MNTASNGVAARTFKGGSRKKLKEKGAPMAFFVIEE